MTSTKNVAVETGFYDLEVDGLERDEMEKLLGRIEAPAAQAVKSLAASGSASLTRKQRQDISYFVAAQWLRGPDRTAFFEEMSDAVVKAELIMMNDEELRRNVCEADGTPVSDDEFLAFRDFILEGEGYSLAHKNTAARIVSQHLEAVARWLDLAFEWKVVQFPCPWLITCDVPVGLIKSPDAPVWAGVGITNASAIEFPLGPSSLLVLRSCEPGDAKPENETLIQGDLERLVASWNTVAGWAHRAIIMHPANPAYDHEPIPPQRGPRTGMEELVEMAYKIREVPRPTSV